MNRFSLIMIVLALTISFSRTACRNVPKTQNYLQETKEERDARMNWWREARFGMFIHWGLYAVPAGEYNGKRCDGIGEWIQATLNIPREEYEEFAKVFNPVRFDAVEWVRAAKDAGMKYLVITSKHHDGFALWDSKVSDYDVIDATPYGKDILAALSEECKKQGVIFCLYHSILDWHHPAQYVDPDAPNPRRGYSRNKIHPDRKKEYLDYMKAQLKEIIAGYDPAVLWFDGEWVEWWTEEDGRDLYNYVRSLKPEIIVNNRVGKGRKGMEGLSNGPEFVGDFGTPEQRIPATGLPGVDWESCMTINDTWGYKHFDDNWKSTDTLLTNLIDIASKGGNYLLNVGPTAEGLIPEPSVVRLEEIGEWLDVHGEALYATSASPFERPEWGRYTQKSGKLYAHIFDFPTNNTLQIPVKAENVKKAYLLSESSQSRLEVKSDGNECTVSLPAKPAEIISVVAVEHTAN